MNRQLSWRELDILRLIGYGHSVGEIAVQRGLSVKTVSTYRGRLLEKLDLKTTGDLMRYALQQGYAPDPPRLPE